jgi:anti-sigma B factor antagonist
MLSVMIENSGNVAVLRCSGRIVAGEEAWTLYNTAISLENKRVVVLDLTRVSSVDAGGVGVLVLLKQWARGAGVKLKVLPSRPVLELLELTGLHSLFGLGSGESVQPASEFSVGSREGSTMGIGADD